MDTFKNLLTNAFPNLKPAQINAFIENLFQYNGDLPRFKLALRDFLISLREFADDNAELYAEEREQEAKDAREIERQRAKQVGGLMKPADMDDDEL